MNTKKEQTKTIILVTFVPLGRIQNNKCQMSSFTNSNSPNSFSIITVQLYFPFLTQTQFFAEALGGNTLVWPVDLSS